ncbi:MAG: DUF1499 domain-containing protein [Pseudomonadota bacterium]
MRFLALFVLLIVAVMAYVRFAPTNTAKWHILPNADGPGDVSEDGGFIAVRRITVPGTEALSALEQRALATPRTRVIAGNVAEGMLTFQTRSLVMGFPDHTTVGIKDGLLIIHGRLRFGRSDLGVNRARIAGWLETLGPLTEPL